MEPSPLVDPSVQIMTSPISDTSNTHNHKHRPHEARTLVLCFDGTGSSFDDENTNVVRFFSALEKRRRDKQLCYYQPGIGESHMMGHSLALRD